MHAMETLTPVPPGVNVVWLGLGRRRGNGCFFTQRPMPTNLPWLSTLTLGFEGVALAPRRCVWVFFSLAPVTEITLAGET